MLNAAQTASMPRFVSVFNIFYAFYLIFRTHFNSFRVLFLSNLLRRCVIFDTGSLHTRNSPIPSCSGLAELTLKKFNQPGEFPSLGSQKPNCCFHLSDLMFVLGSVMMQNETFVGFTSFVFVGGGEGGSPANRFKINPKSANFTLKPPEDLLPF